MIGLSDTAVLTSVHPPESKCTASFPGRVHTPCPTETAASRWRHNSWKDTRDRIYESLQRTYQSANRLAAFESCGDRLYVLQHKQDPERVVLAGSGCHDRFCLPCANARSRLIAQRVLCRLGGQRARFLTLTLKTGNEPLVESLDRLYAGFAALRRTRAWKEHVDGGVAFLEVKWMPAGLRWHPHLHCLLQGRFFPHPLIKAEWLRITGDSDIVDIRPVACERQAASYVTKYASKPFNTTFTHEPDLLDEAILAFRGRRLALTFGTWRGYRLTTPLEETEWICLGSLDSFLADAGAGDRLKARLLPLLPREVVAAYMMPARSPPGWSVEPVAPEAFQPTLFACDWFR